MQLSWFGKFTQSTVRLCFIKKQITFISNFFFHKFGKVFNAYFFSGTNVDVGVADFIQGWRVEGLKDSF